MRYFRYAICFLALFQMSHLANADPVPPSEPPQSLLNAIVKVTYGAQGAPKPSDATGALISLNDQGYVHIKLSAGKDNPDFLIPMNLVISIEKQERQP